MGPALRVILLVVTVGALLLQLRTVLRVGTAGLAPATWFGLVASALVWLGYGIATSEATVIMVNVPVLLVALAIVAAIVRSGLVPMVAVTPYLIGPVLVWCGAWLTGASWLLGVAGTSLVVGRLLPQLVRALQAIDRSGISVGAWLGNGATNLVWAAYGFNSGDGFVLWPSVTSAILSFTIAGVVAGELPRRTALGRRRARVGSPRPAAARSV